MHLRRALLLATALLLLLAAVPLFATGEQEEEIEEVAPGIPRNETLIIDQIFRYPEPGNYNFWIPGTSTPTRQALINETLWYVDQQTAEWINGIAATEPIYNDDYTQMTVEVREDIFWSDGEQITAEDVVFTTKTLMENEGMLWGAELRRYVDDVYMDDEFTAVFELTQSNSRFHSHFTARYNSIYIMPEHVWAEVDNPLTFKFYPPVSAGQYLPVEHDPQGSWEIFKRHEGYQDTVVAAVVGEDKAPPKYILHQYPGPYEQYVIAMAEHDLDLFMEVTPEAFEALLDRSETAESWYPDYPWVWQDELDMRGLTPNNAKELYENKDVRWALALALDMFEVETVYMDGLTRIASIPQPPTPVHLGTYYKDLQPWFEDLEIEVEDGETFQVYDADLPERLYQWALDQGHELEGGPNEVYGYGWYKHAPEVAARLLEKHGFSRDNNGNWLTPDGERWSISIPIAPDEPSQYQITLAAEDMWSEFGINVQVITLEREPYYTRQNLGDYDVMSNWGGGSGFYSGAARDKWPYIQSLHSDFYTPPGDITTINTARINDPEVDRLVEEIGALPPDDPENYELTLEFFKYYVEEMLAIPMVGFTKFITTDSGVYWENFPKSDDPYYQPNFWFIGGKFFLPHLEQVQ